MCLSNLVKALKQTHQIEVNEVEGEQGWADHFAHAPRLHGGQGHAAHIDAHHALTTAAGSARRGEQILQFCQMFFSDVVFTVPLSQPSDMQWRIFFLEDKIRNPILGVKISKCPTWTQTRKV